MNVFSKMTEIWKDIDGFPKYQVSNFGRVKSSFRIERILTPRIKNGYHALRLCRNKIPYEKYIHRLVLEAFKENPDPAKYTVCDHINRNSMDNRLENLRWSTPQLNGFNTNCRGYSFDKQMNKFRSFIRIDGKNVYLGSFDYSIHARQAYLAAKKKYLNKIDPHHDY